MKTYQKFITTFVTLATLTMLGCKNSFSKPVAPITPTKTLTNTPTDSSTNAPADVSAIVPTEVLTNVPTNPIAEIPTTTIPTHIIINSVALREEIDPVFNKYCSVVFIRDSKVELDYRSPNWQDERIEIAKGSKHLAVNWFGQQMILITYNGRIEKAKAETGDIELNCPWDLNSIWSTDRPEAEMVAIREIKDIRSSRVSGLECLISKGTKASECRGGYNCNFATECGKNYVDIYENENVAELIPIHHTGRYYGACNSIGVPGITPPSCMDYFDFYAAESAKSSCEANPNSKWLDKCPSEKEEEKVGICSNEASHTINSFYGLVEGKDLEEECNREGSRFIKLYPRPTPVVLGVCSITEVTGNNSPSCWEIYLSKKEEAIRSDKEYAFKTLCEGNKDSWLDKCPSENIVGGCLNKIGNFTIWYYEGSDKKESCKEEGNQWVNDKATVEALIKVQ